MKKHVSRELEILKTTTNRREYHILYNRNIRYYGYCPQCSKRCGDWVYCSIIWNSEHDNPVKSWKYKSKKRKQWQ